MLLSLMPPPVLSTCMNPACVQRAPGQNMASPLRKLFPHCYFLLPVLSPHTSSSVVAPPPTTALSYHSSPSSPNLSFQSLHPTCPTPTTPTSKPRLFPTPDSITQPYSNLDSDCTIHLPPHQPPSIALHPNQILHCIQDPSSSCWSTLLPRKQFISPLENFFPP